LVKFSIFGQIFIFLQIVDLGKSKFPFCLKDFFTKILILTKILIFIKSWSLKDQNFRFLPKMLFLSKIFDFWPKFQFWKVLSELILTIRPVIIFTLKTKNCKYFFVKNLSKKNGNRIIIRLRRSDSIRKNGSSKCKSYFPFWLLDRKNWRSIILWSDRQEMGIFVFFRLSNPKFHFR